MDNTSFPVLCGGTFFTLLLEATKPGLNERKKWGGNSNFHGGDVLEALLRVSIPNYAKPSDSVNFKSTVSAYKCCNPEKSGRLGAHNQATITTFDYSVKNNYLTPLNSMNTLVEKYIDINGKGIWLVRALLQLISEDANIKESSCFYVFPDGTSATKGSLHEVTEVCLPAFLLGIWHYIIVTPVDNGKGRKTYDEWCRPGNAPNTRAPFQSSIGDNIIQQITLCPIENIDSIEEFAEHPSLNLNNDESKTGNTSKNETTSTAKSCQIVNNSNIINQHGNIQIGNNNLIIGSINSLTINND